MRAEAGGFCGCPPAPGGAGWAGDGCDQKTGAEASQALKLAETISQTLELKWKWIGFNILIVVLQIDVQEFYQFYQLWCIEARKH